MGGFVKPQGENEVSLSERARIEQLSRQRHEMHGIPYPGDAGQASPDNSLSPQQVQQLHNHAAERRLQMEDRVPKGLPSAMEHINLNGQSTIMDFNNGNRSMEGLAGKLKEGSPIPPELKASIEKNGKDFIEFMVKQGVDILQTKEFAGAGVAGSDGKADPKKVGALLFAAASVQEGYSRTEGPAKFDNKLTAQDFARLNDPDVRSTILNTAANVEKGVLSSNPPPRLNGNTVLQEAAQALQNCGVSCANPTQPVQPTPPQIGGQSGPEFNARC